MELKIEEYELKPIGFNFEELKKELEIQLEKYQNLVFTKDMLKDAKKTRTDLNNLITSIENERKRIKKEWNQPYVEFENKIKELVALIEQPKLAIDTQIKTHEDKKKQEKKKELENYFNKINESTYLKFEMIFDEKWLNDTTDVKKIKESISSRVGSFATGVAAIERQDEKYRVQMLDVYIKTMELSQALLEKDRLEKLEFESTKRMIAEDIQNANIEKNVSNKKITRNETSNEEELEVLDFRVYVTRSQKLALRDYLIANNIKFGRVE